MNQISEMYSEILFLMIFIVAILYAVYIGKRYDKEVRKSNIHKNNIVSYKKCCGCCNKTSAKLYFVPKDKV